MNTIPHRLERRKDEDKWRYKAWLTSVAPAGMLTACFGSGVRPEDKK